MLLLKTKTDVKLHLSSAFELQSQSQLFSTRTSVHSLYFIIMHVTYDILWTGVFFRRDSAQTECSMCLFLPVLSTWPGTDSPTKPSITVMANVHNSIQKCVYVGSMWLSSLFTFYRCQFTNCAVTNRRPRGIDLLVKYVICNACSLWRLEFWKIPGTVCNPLSPRAAVQSYR